MRKVGGWRSLNERPSDRTIDLAARSGNLVTLEIIAPKSIPTQIVTATGSVSKCCDETTNQGFGRTMQTTSWTMC
ncbi:MAG TPA: hypothetical protein VIH87_13515 [Methylocella sp.]